MPLNVKQEDLMNSVLGKLYDTLTNGDETMQKSDDNYLAWCTPGIPYDPEDFNFLKEGFRGFEKKTEAHELLSNDSSTNTDESTDELPVEEKTEAQKDQERADDAFGKYNAAEAFSRLADFIPDASNINPKGGITSNVWNVENKLSQVYEEVLTFSQVPNDELDDETKEKIERLRGYLSQKVVVKELNDALEEVEVEKMVDSPMKIKYFEKMAEYEDAVLEYNIKRINALSGTTPSAVHDWAMNANIYRNKVKAAMNNWISNGFKTTYERINAYISQVEGRSMMLLKEKYKDDFEKSKLTSANSGMEFMYASLVPAGFVKNGGWTQFTFTESDFNSSYERTKQSFQGAGGLSLGVFNLMAKGGYEKQESENQMDMTNFNLSFEICQVQIVRPWLNINFLKGPYWRFDQNSSTHANTLLSDGKTPPEGRAPVITTSCIFVRNLRLNFANSSSFAQDIQKKINAGGTVGYGPFVIGGNYSRADANGSRNFSYDSQGIKIDGMQLIGFKCHVLPQSPNPDTNIENWV